MTLPHVNYLAVLVSGVVIFVLGGLWYSPVLFAKKWMTLLGKTEEELKAASSSMRGMYLATFVCGLLTAWVLAVMIHHVTNPTAVCGGMLGGICWLGFAAATSLPNALFSQKPKALWAIDTGYNLVAFVIAGIILAIWT